MMLGESIFGHKTLETEVDICGGKFGIWGVYFALGVCFWYLGCLFHIQNIGGCSD